MDRCMISALQTVDFNFFGDILIAVKDNSTNEVYAGITHILRGIGFTDKQIEHQQKKIISDVLFAYPHTRKFSGVDLNLPSINEIWCISSRKLPMMLAKINITPKMKKDHPELSERLLKYQDKCADVLAKVFIDRKDIVDYTAINTLTQAITTLTSTITSMQQDISIIKEQQTQKQLTKKKFSRWTKRMFPKYKLFIDYFDIDRNELYHNLFLELQNLYPDIDLTQLQEDYCFENGLDSCYTMDVIEHNKKIRTLFEHMVDDLLDRYKLKPEADEEYALKETIFT